MSSLRGAVVIALLGMFLAGCTVTPRPVPADREAAWAQRRARLRALSGWLAEGRFSVQTGREGAQAGFTWVDTGRAGFRLRLSGPFGEAAGRLIVDRRGAVLVTRQGRRYRGAEAARLIRSLYGWNIPVERLRHWLLGLPGKGTDYRLDRYGRLKTIKAGPWRIRYVRYRSVGGLELPALLTAQHTRRDTQIRVAIHRWAPAGGERPGAAASPVPLIGGD